MRILGVQSYGGLGGAELAGATFLHHRPESVEAGALLVSDGPLRGILSGLGLPVWHGSGFRGRPTAIKLAGFTRTLQPLLRQWRPDVVWATGQKAALLCLPACRTAGVPLVWHKVDFSWDRFLAQPLALGVNGVIGVSHAVLEAVGPLRRSRVLGTVGPPIALDSGLAAAPGEGRPTIGTLGRLVPYKGHHHIVRAAALLRGEFPDLRVVLAGAPAAEYPDYPDALTRLAREMGLEAHIDMPGHVPPEDVLPRITVFVNATYRDEEGFGLEGLSGAMLEAGWVGVPVVAVRGGGTGEGVRDGETGTLVDSADPALLAGAVAPYLRDRELARQTGVAARSFVRSTFAPDRGAERLFAMLSIVASPSRERDAFNRR
jgi:glycosyltransferase involved in cell wall biosynthesis